MRKKQGIGDIKFLFAQIKVEKLVRHPDRLYKSIAQRRGLISNYKFGSHQKNGYI